jgi:hypothetical protein
MTTTRKPSTLSAAQVEAVSQFAHILRLLNVDEEGLGHFKVRGPTQSHDDTVSVVIETKSGKTIQLKGTMVLKKRSGRWQLYRQASEVTNGFHHAACEFDYDKMIYIINRGPIGVPFWEQLRISVVTQTTTIKELE